jgi:hypothetical protein
VLETVAEALKKLAVTLTVSDSLTDFDIRSGFPLTI